MNKAVFLFLLINLAGCATYQGKVDLARDLIGQGKADQAASRLEPLAHQEGKDQLVYLFDYATALQLSGNYKKSNEIFQEADKLSDLKNYHSVSKIASSLVLNEEQSQYKGEDYEKVLINVMSAVNYLNLGNLEEALVECRRINEKLNYYRTEEKKNYEQNIFAFYLSALAWESDRKWDDAYISYNDAYKQDSSIPYLQEDLIRAARRAHRIEDLSRWKKDFGSEALKKAEEKKGNGNLALIYMQGWGPRKYPHPESPRFPKLLSVFSRTRFAKLVVEGSGEEVSQMIYSAEKVAIKTLDDAYAALVAKRLAGLAAKKVLSDQVSQKDSTLGALLWIGLNISDRADLRQWSTLPATFQIAKMSLPPGRHRVKIVGLDQYLVETGEFQDSVEIDVRPNRTTFIAWRSVK